jgi:hypothetical protein
MTYEKRMGGSFGANIKAELMEFRARLDAMEAQLKTMGSGGSSSGGQSGISETTTETDVGSVSVGDTSSQGVKATSDEVDNATSNIKSYTDSVVDATYLIREASVAMRGYGMLLDQMGLSKDQKKLIHDMEETMMMVYKVIQTLRLLEAANLAFEAGSGGLGMLEIGLAGGVFAGSMAYGSKVVGGL